jgi:hypothetical protein
MSKILPITSRNIYCLGVGGAWSELVVKTLGVLE